MEQCDWSKVTCWVLIDNNVFNIPQSNFGKFIGLWEKNNCLIYYRGTNPFILAEISCECVSDMLVAKIGRHDIVKKKFGQNFDQKKKFDQTFYQKK